MTEPTNPLESRKKRRPTIPKEFWAFAYRYQKRHQWNCGAFISELREAWRRRNAKANRVG